MSLNEHITVNLTQYIESANPQYAFLITGGWGAGKTYYIERYIERQNSEKIKIVKISLFGLSRTSEINERLFEQLHPILGSKYARLAGKLAKGAISFGVKLDLNSDNSPESTVSAKLDKIEVLDFFSSADSKKEIILVLDDLERSGIPLKDSLGYINELTDIVNVKVILLFNEGEVDDSQKQLYRLFKEKVIGKTFEVSHDLEEVLTDFLDGFDKISRWAPEILDIYRKSGYKNLRKLKHSISDFDFLCDHVSDDYVANAEFFSCLVTNFFALSIESKAGAITEEDLRLNKPFQKVGKTGADQKNFHDIYFSAGQPLYSGDVWANIIFKGRFKDINEQTSKLLFFVKTAKQSTPGWIKMLNFYELENEEFSDLIAELKQELVSLQDTDLRVYLHKLSIAIYFSKNGLLDLSVSDILSVAEEYIEKYKDSQSWSESSLSGSVFSDGGGYGYLAGNDEDFGKIKEHICKVNAKSFEKGEAVRQKKASEEMAVFIKNSNIEDLSKALLETYQLVPILVKMSPEQFVERLINAKNADVKAVNDIMHFRYRDNVYTNNVHNFTYLKDEREFWIQSQELLLSRIDEVLGLKRYLLTLFVKGTVTKFIKLLSD